MATLLMRPGNGGSSGDKKRRARKGKNAQKKQPQRGLGVAQLEKLRLQEQSLLCPTPPSYTLRLSTTDSDYHRMARCDTDAVSQTVLPLTTSNVHGQAGGGGGGSSSSSVVRGGAVEAGTLSRLCALNGHSTTAQSCLSPHLAAHDMRSKCTGAEAFHAATKRAVASRGLACLSQSSKFSSVNASFFSSVLTATQLQILESQAQAQQKVAEEWRAAAASRGIVENSGNAAAAASASAFIFPSSVTNYPSKETPATHVNNEGLKLHPLFRDHVPAPTSITRTNSAKELSSFQSYASQQAWPSAEKVAGRKRPWFALQENSRHGCDAQALDLNAPFEESDAGHNERRPNQDPEFRVGAHYTTGIVRTALGNSSLPPTAKVKVCSSGSHWQDNESPSHVTAYFPEMGVYSENAIGFRHCPSQSSMNKDSCSSVTGPSSHVSRNRQTSSKDQADNTPATLVEKESICSNFLTLGISSSSFPDRNGLPEPEESIQDNTPTSIMADVSRLKQQQETTTTSGCCEGDNHCSQVRISICTQEVLGGFDLKGDPSQFLSLEYDHGSGMRRKSSKLLRDSHMASSHFKDRFPSSLTPPSIASNSPRHADESNVDYNPSRSEPFVEDILDLRLKLAL